MNKELLEQAPGIFDQGKARKDERNLKALEKRHHDEIKNPLLTPYLSIILS